MLKGKHSVDGIWSRSTAATFTFEPELNHASQFGSELDILEERIAALQTRLITLSMKKGSQAATHHNSPFNKWTEYGAIKRELKLVNKQKQALMHRMRESSRNHASTLPRKWDSNPITNGLPYVLDDKSIPSTTSLIHDNKENTMAINKKEMFPPAQSSSCALGSFDESSIENEDEDRTLREVPSSMFMDLVMGKENETQQHEEDIPAMSIAANEDEDETFIANMVNEFDNLMSFLESDANANNNNRSLPPLVFEETDLININDRNSSSLPRPTATANVDEVDDNKEEESNNALVPDANGFTKDNKFTLPVLEWEKNDLSQFTESISQILSILVDDDRVFYEQQPQQQEPVEIPQYIPFCDGEETSSEFDMEAYSATLLAERQTIICAWFPSAMCYLDFAKKRALRQ